MRTPPGFALPASLVTGLAAAVLAPSVARATTYPVGPTRAHHSPCALINAMDVTLAPGDVITVDPGTYNESCVIDTVSGTAAAPITLQGAAGGARAVMDGTGMSLTGDGGSARAVLQFSNSNHWVVQHMEFRGGNNTTQNAGGLRVTENSTDVTLNDLSVHDNQVGIVSSTGATVALTASEVFNNGVAGSDGVGHNVFLAGESARLTGNYIHDARGGQDVRLRMHYAEVTYNYLSHAAAYEMDMVHDDDSETPDSSTVMVGNVVVRLPEATNVEQTINFGVGTGTSVGRSSSLYAAFNTFIMHDTRNRLIRALPATAGATLTFSDNIVHGIPTGTLLLDGAAVAFDAATAALFHGSNNWITTGIAVPSPLTVTLTGANPGFASATNYTLSNSSAVIDRGVTPPPYLDATGAMQSGLPTREFQTPLGTVVRTILAAPDLGAYEATVTAPPDAGTDAGTSDAGPGDGSTTDGATMDGGSLDAPGDASDDAGAQDAGGADSALADAGNPQTDAGSASDSGTTQGDAVVTSPDSGPTMPAGTGTSGSGCGCAVPTGGNGPDAAVLAGLALGAVLVRRRRG